MRGVVTGSSFRPSCRRHVVLRVSARELRPIGWGSGPCRRTPSRCLTPPPSCRVPGTLAGFPGVRQKSDARSSHWLIVPTILPQARRPPCKCEGITPASAVESRSGAVQSSSNIPSRCLTRGERLRPAAFMPGPRWGLNSGWHWQGSRRTSLPSHGSILPFSPGHLEIARGVHLLAASSKVLHTCGYMAKIAHRLAQLPLPPTGVHSVAIENCTLGL